ncbi:hypothetical protein BUALT_Bualt17G0077900 [Buddleja alternifolia]|uniref:Remorin C-terminal domain-containing protein n=1 Tax=Buddleja alternifolia TaxID=168488 RepID=A0AAV6WEL3_9LAMI|nr:hypothetical protein BUALT_Bualt17G0077900 [Buddleja alternifolia]
MDILLKQTRARFYGTQHDNKEESSNTRDRKIPPQKTQSFRERKRSQSWIRRQFSRQMSSDYDISGADYPTAVAAAAYAIQSLEESKHRDKNERTYGHGKPLNKTKSNVEDDTGVPPEPLKSALKVSDEASKASYKDPDIKVPISTSTSKKMPEKGTSTAPSFKKRISFGETDANTSNKPEKPLRELAPPSMRRPPSFADKQLNITDNKKDESKLDRPPTPRPSATKPGPGDSQADAWQKEQMASINERCVCVCVCASVCKNVFESPINLSLMEKFQAELDKKRAKAMQNHRSEIERIEGIAGGAKAQAEENRRKEEFKVKEKANKIRSTGKIPATCLCF